MVYMLQILVFHSTNVNDNKIIHMHIAIQPNNNWVSIKFDIKIR